MRTWRGAVLISIGVLALAAAQAHAQDDQEAHPGTPPDPSTYEGSMELQRRSDQQDLQDAQDMQRRTQEQQQWQEQELQRAYARPPAPAGPQSSGSEPPASRVPGPRVDAPPPVPTGALVRLQVRDAKGAALAGAHLWVTAADPLRALTAAGIPPIGSSLAQLTYDCQVTWVCVRDFKVMTAGAVGVYTTDAAGRAQTGTIPPGRYFLIGYRTQAGGTLVWAGPMRVQPGVNAVTLDEADGSLVTQLK